jgi:hypothetical protein
MSRRAAALVGGALLVLGTARKAHAADGEGDGTYGRLEGDLAVAGAVGVTAGPRGPRGAVDARFRYLSTAGLFASYEDGALLASAADPKRALAFGVELRPLFLARWATGRELGNPRLDLAIDSLGLELGAVFLQPNGSHLGGHPGLQAGLGFEVPFFTRSSGPFLAVHGGVRWSDGALAGEALAGPSDRAAFVAIVVGWQALFGGHVVDLGDVRASR